MVRRVDPERIDERGANEGVHGPAAAAKGVEQGLGAGVFGFHDPIAYHKGAPRDMVIRGAAARRT